MAKYTLHVHTGDQVGAGTQAKVHCTIIGTSGRTKKMILGKSLLKNEQQQKNDSEALDFEAGSVNVFEFEEVVFGIPFGLEIGHDCSGVTPGWFLEKCVLRINKNDTETEYVFPCGKWLSKHHDDHQVERTLHIEPAGTKREDSTQESSKLESLARKFSFGEKLAKEALKPRDSKIFLGTPPDHFPPTANRGKKKGVFIGVTYDGSPDKLFQSKDDTLKVEKIFREKLGFKDTVILVEDSQNPKFTPNFDNMVGAFCWLTQDCAPGDILVFYYNGHGYKFFDFSPASGKKSLFSNLLCPLDGPETGNVISDEDLHNALLARVPKTVNFTSFFDCCVSGTILDNDTDTASIGASFSACLDSQVSWETSGSGSEFSAALEQTLSVPGILEKTYQQFFEELSKIYYQIQKIGDHKIAIPTFFVHKLYLDVATQKFLGSFV